MAAGSSYFSTKVNDGTPRGLIGVLIFGFMTTFLWAFLSKVTQNLLRDSLIWDVMYFATFSLVLVYFGYGANYQPKHWVGIGMLAASFGYWLVIDWL